MLQRVAVAGLKSKLRWFLSSFPSRNQDKDILGVTITKNQQFIPKLTTSQCIKFTSLEIACFKSEILFYCS